MNPDQLLAGKSAADVSVGTHPEKHRVEIVDQARERNIRSDVGAEHKLDAHFFHYRAPRRDDLLLQLERRNAKGEQSADLRIAIEDDCLYTVTRKYVGGTQPGRPGADDGNAFIGRFYV